MKAQADPLLSLIILPPGFVPKVMLSLHPHTYNDNFEEYFALLQSIASTERRSDASNLQEPVKLTRLSLDPSYIKRFHHNNSYIATAVRNRGK